jgi:hypothetical protein
MSHHHYPCHHHYPWHWNWDLVISGATASANSGPGGGIHIGTAVVTHGGPQHPSGTLPFTGFDALGFALLGIAMIVAGLRLRWGAR